MDRMKQAQFGAILFGMGVTMTRGKHNNSEAILALARDMNHHTRWVAKPMRGHGNVTGADNVVTWSTGYPFGVSLTRGYPRFNPGEFTTSDLLARGEADAALIVASDPMSNFSPPARDFAGYYNNQRCHETLDHITPADPCFGSLACNRPRSFIESRLRSGGP